MKYDYSKLQKPDGFTNIVEGWLNLAFHLNRAKKTKNQQTKLINIYNYET